MRSTDTEIMDGQRPPCPAMTLPPELWITILLHFNTLHSPYARRQIMRVVLVSSYFHALALPILYAHIPLDASGLPTIRNRFDHPNDHSEPTFTVPAMTALTTLSSRPTLFPAVKSIRFLGHLDTVLLTRRTSIRTSDILIANELRDLLTATLPHLISLRSIFFSAVALTSALCSALFYLPALTQLTLKDCRAPAPACSIFRDCPGEIRLTAVSLTISSWRDTPEEVELLSAFLHGPKLESLTTDQPRVLGSLLARDLPPQLRRLELQNFGEGDAQLVTQFLAKECATLRELTFVRCESATWATEVDNTFPRLPELQSYTGPRGIAHWFVGPGARVEHVQLNDNLISEDGAGLSDLRMLANSGRPLRSLYIRLHNESLVDDTIWNALAELFPSLQVLRVAHHTLVEEFQVRVLPKCRATLSALRQLGIFALISAMHRPDLCWQRAVVLDLGSSRPTLREISFDPKATWIRLADGEWKSFSSDDS